MSKWNHNICWDCWRKQEPERVPVRIGTGTDRLSEAELEDACCYCGRLNLEGIYRRADAATVPCEGRHRGIAYEIGIH